MVGLFVVMALLLIWLGWFLLAQITLYETGETVEIAETGIIIAQFPAEAQGRIKPRQMARLLLNGEIGTKMGPIAALVTEVIHPPQHRQIQVKLYAPMVDTAPPAFFQEGLTGRVEIEVEQVSPATLVIRASGQFLEAREISVSPQNPLELYSK